MLLFEIGIENHGEIADKDAAKPGGAYFILRKQNQAVRARDFEAFELRGEIRIEVDAEFGVDFFLGNHGVAEQSADDVAAYVVVLRKMIAAHGGKAAVVYGFLPVDQVAVILRVGIAEAADGGDTHAI